MAPTIEEVEREIDASFAANSLAKEGFAQAAWTLLSVNEDQYLKALYAPSAEIDLHIFADRSLNALTYPLRVCYGESETTRAAIRSELINDHYGLAWEWLALADRGYYSFSTIFPLWHRKKVTIEISGSRIVVTYPNNENMAYEAYNRIFRKEGKPELDAPAVSPALVETLLAKTTVGEGWFRLNFDPHLVTRLVAQISPTIEPRFSLPPDWSFVGFRLSDYKTVVITLQAMLWGWSTVRQVLANSGMPGLGYRSAVWVVGKPDLLARLRRYTAVDVDTIDAVLELLTFGSNGLRQPDIATQPLIDLRNGSLALSPFVWVNMSAERNLCALLNQIPAQKQVYAALTNEKEVMLRQEIRDFLSEFGFDMPSGNVDGTDLDLAIIDRSDKCCLCLELKWFIEPAEVREIEERTLELRTGVEQARKIKRLYDGRDDRLMKEILRIDDDYDVTVAVASRNWIGHSHAQDPEIPIIKIWHLLHVIRDFKSLRRAAEWLTARSYLPIEGKDFKMAPVEVSCGNWSASWYGMRPLTDST